MSGVINGGPGNDNLNGTSGKNSISAFAGDDKITDNAGGNDTIDGGAGKDEIEDKGGGNDLIIVGNNTAGIEDKVILEGGNDQVVIQNTQGYAVVTTGVGNDTIWWDGTGDPSNQHVVDAKEGNDILLYGGPGTQASNFKFIGGNNSTEGGATIYRDLNNNGVLDSNEPRLYWQNAIAQHTTQAAPCFATGTRIATTRGEVAVEDLRVGDLVLTPRAAAKVQPIVWIGHTRVNVAAHPNRATVAPILVKEGAIAEGVPHRDLRVSPDHAFFIDGRLIPAKHLVNGSSIVQEAWCPQVTYWHVELPEHAVIVSEGAATESYLDDCNRQNFDNGAVAMLFKDFESHRGNGRYDAEACYPLLRSGTLLEILRGRLVARAAELERRARATG